MRAWLCALSGKREALRSVGTHGKRPALLIPANNDVTQAIWRFRAKAERDSLARRTGRRGVAGHFVLRMTARGVGYRQYGVMLFDVVKRQASPLPVRDKQQRLLLRISAQPQFNIGQLPCGSKRDIFRPVKIDVLVLRIQLEC